MECLSKTFKRSKPQKTHSTCYLNSLNFDSIYISKYLKKRICPNHAKLSPFTRLSTISYLCHGAEFIGGQVLSHKTASSTSVHNVIKIPSPTCSH